MNAGARCLCGCLSQHSGYHPYVREELMVAREDNGVGRFAVEVELANNRDVERAAAGDIAASAIRRIVLRGVVDSGATRLVIPESVLKTLGLQPGGPARVRYADGRTEERPMAAGVHLSYAGRSGVFSAIVEPARESALLGAIVLEDLDLIVDCSAQALVPRDPKQIVSEIE